MAQSRPEQMIEYFSYELLLFIGIGFLAQAVDGALGMAYGVIATSVLLAIGTTPALASASIHAAEIVTTGLASGSHVWHKNVDWRLARRLAVAGVAGGVLGAYVLVGLPEYWVKLFITVYLIGMTFLIGRRILKNKKAEEGSKAQRERKLPTVPVGAAGGFLDAIGGGGWGPLVTSTLVARGDHPRKAIGSSSVAEFFLTVSISITFLMTLDVSKYFNVMIGLIIGGAVAAPLAGLLSKILPPRILLVLVGSVIGLLSIYNLISLMMDMG